MVRTANDRKSLECVERRRRRDRPFERSRCWAPGIVTSKPLLGKCVIKQVDEQNRSDAGKVGSEGGNPVPVSESVRIVNVAAWHARKAKECCGKKVRFTLAKITQKCIFPIASLYM